jgi:NAD(P)-dependent dehydrogenase (short-subunit alcohol dehydrogenase family)
MAEEFLKKGWNVVGTVRAGSGRTKLHDLADEFKGRLEVETQHICEQAQVTALRERLSGRVFEMLFVNAGTTNNEKETLPLRSRPRSSYVSWSQMRCVRSVRSTHAVPR